MKYEDFVLKRNDNDLYPRLDFVIVKYNPKKYNTDGIYTDDNEWTCIDEAYRNGMVEDYIAKEDAFVGFFKSVLGIKACQRLVLHMWSGFIDSRASSKLLNTADLYRKYRHLKDYSVVDVPTACDLLRLSLRNGLDCSIVNVSHGVEFMVGYEYYLHMRCPGIDYRILEQLAESNGLFLNPRADVSSKNIKYDKLSLWLQNAGHGDTVDPSVFDNGSSYDYLYEVLYFSDTILFGKKPRLKAALCLTKPKSFNEKISSFDDIMSYRHETKLLVFQPGRKVRINDEMFLIRNCPMEWKQYCTNNNNHYLYI